MRRLLVLAALCWAVGALQTTVYVTNWSQYRPVGCTWKPLQLKAVADKITQAVYSFVYLNEDFSPKPIEPNDEELMAELKSLKEINPNLKLLLAVGGWSMNTPGSGYENRLSDMVSTAENRMKFIDAAMAFCKEHGFDGLDIDWEYPGIEERGGRKEDRQNFVELVKEFRGVINAKDDPFMLTLAVAVSWYGLQGVDLANMHQHVDYINLMSYDLGYNPVTGWGNTTMFHTPWENPAGESIKDALDMFINQQHIPVDKLVLGLGLYGRSWTLKSGSSSSGDVSSASTETKKTVCTPAAAATAEEEPGCKYTVKSGDIAYDIAASYNITLEDLVAQNAGLNANSLMVGQELSVPCTPNRCTYTVKSGDIAFNIAADHNATLDELTAANPGVNMGNLMVGQELVVKCETGPPKCKYTVKTGDILFDIANTHQTTLENLTALNVNLNPNSLFVGQELIVPCPEPEPTKAETECTQEVVSAGSVNIVAPGAAAIDLGAPGECTGDRGFLAWREIKKMLDMGAIETVDYTAKAAYAMLGDQWVSYDNPETIGLKVQEAKSRGLGGVMVWSADLDDTKYTLINAIYDKVME